MSDEEMVTVAMPRDVAMTRKALLEYQRQCDDIGDLSRRELEALSNALASPPVDLDAICDSDFTGGLHPVDYLDRLHAGTLDRTPSTDKDE